MNLVTVLVDNVYFIIGACFAILIVTFLGEQQGIIDPHFQRIILVFLFLTLAGCFCLLYFGRN